MQHESPDQQQDSEYEQRYYEAKRRLIHIELHSPSYQDSKRPLKAR
jgi:hypothetical protein